MNNQYEPLPPTSTSLQETQIRMYGTNTVHRQLTNPHKDNYQYQCTLIQLIQTKKSTKNNANMKNKLQRTIHLNEMSGVN